MTKTSDAAATYITCIKHKTKQFLAITEFHRVKLQVLVDSVLGRGTGGDIQMKIILVPFSKIIVTLLHNIAKLHGDK